MTDGRRTATLHFDGGTYPRNPGHGGAGAVLHVEGGEPLAKSKYLGPRVSNNQAEYGGLILGLRAALELGVTHLRVYGDSQLIIRQMNEEYQCRHPGLVDLQREAQALVRRFRLCEFFWVPREENAAADAAASEGLKKR